MKFQPGKLYIVSWLDAGMTSSWISASELPEEMKRVNEIVEIVAFFVGSDQNFHYFTPGIHQGYLFGLIYIPKGMVVRCERLSTPTRR